MEVKKKRLKDQIILCLPGLCEKNIFKMFVRLPSNLTGKNNIVFWKI